MSFFFTWSWSQACLGLVLFMALVFIIARTASSHHKVEYAESETSIMEEAYTWKHDEAHPAVPAPSPNHHDNHNPQRR